MELHRLAPLYGLVACVTGRPSDIAREIVGVPELTYVGEHGLELDGEAKRWAGRIHAFAAGVGWQWLENKPLSSAFHYRQADDHGAARIVLEEVASHAARGRIPHAWGRFVLEVLPPLDVNKGTAVRALLAQTGLRRALYAGDDTTDLDGFDALDGLDVAVLVAVVSAEGPTELGERADLLLGSPEAVAELLSQL